MVRVGGKQIKKSLRTSDPDLAKQAIFALRRKLLGRSAAPAQICFTALAHAWLETIIADRPTRTKIVGWLIRGFDPRGNRLVREIGQHDILSWRARRLREISGRTVNYHLMTLNAIFKYGVDVARVLLENPALA